MRRNPFDLRCEIREKLIAVLQTEMPKALPRERTDISPPLALHDDFERAPARMAAEAHREH